ncbi:MAG: pyridoxamine 5'-phosphate oxidase family protein [Methanocellales archaeon]|nr:pyridoxamine 5'-phosphate oxidase family protein [Methanocellales archaeon]
MFKIDDELKEAISRIRPAMVATANKGGQPNVSPKGSVRLLDDRHLLFADIRSPNTIKNLRENPYLSMIGLDPTSRKGWRIWGKAVEIATSGDLYDQLCDQFKDKGALNHVVKVIVENGITF